MSKKRLILIYMPLPIREIKEKPVSRFRQLLSACICNFLITVLVTGAAKHHQASRQKSATISNPVKVCQNYNYSQSQSHHRCNRALTPN